MGSEGIVLLHRLLGNLMKGVLTVRVLKKRGHKPKCGGKQNQISKLRLYHLPEEQLQGLLLQKKSWHSMYPEKTPTEGKINKNLGILTGGGRPNDEKPVS